jgi:hypothetical protein
MKILHVLLVLSLLQLLAVSAAFAQLTESFSDSNFTANPVWQGDTASWKINDSLQLQSNHQQTNSIFYLFVANAMSTNTEWSARLIMDFNPSSTNYIDFFLTASSANLNASTNSGYFIRAGGASDELSLYRKSGDSIIRIIDGINGAFNSSYNDFRFRVTCDSAHRWRLWRLTTNGNVFFEGQATDAVVSGSSFSGLLVKQSTASFFGRHYADDISIGTLQPDVTAPDILRVVVTGSNRLSVQFNEPVLASSATDAQKYLAGNGIGQPTYVLADSLNQSLVHLVFPDTFPYRMNIQLKVQFIEDLNGNISNDLFTVFLRYRPLPFDIVMSEIFADPSPPVGLPEAEWVELTNTTGFDISLKNWRIAAGQSVSSGFTDYLFPAGGRIIIFAPSSQQLLAPLGTGLPVTGFPALANSGTALVLHAADSTIAHTVDYNDKWYKQDFKKEGGWSLEMIDVNNPCSGSSNWAASTDPQGGTPSLSNSTTALNSDTTAPQLLRAYVTDSLHLVLQFDESLYRFSAQNPMAYHIDQGIGNPLLVNATPPFYMDIILQLPVPLQKGIIYQVDATSVKDCSGNTIGPKHTVRVGIPERTDTADVVINEVLFNPKPGQEDFIELYNKSGKLLDLQDLYLARKDDAGQIDDITACSNKPYLFFPGDHLVFTVNKQSLSAAYVVKNLQSVVELASIPSMSDDAGDLLLLDGQGREIDAFSYSDDWHHPLIDNDEGISLERISYFSATQDKNNWQSAAKDIGYGTPTYKNSQSNPVKNAPGLITVTPAIISPDQDGRDDFAIIGYQFETDGNVLSMFVFDAIGRLVRQLQKNSLCGRNGFFKWDGLADNAAPLKPGLYILFTEVFNVDGNTKRYKNSIVLAKKR